MITVLVIDDEEYIRDALRQVLERDECSVQLAAGGEEGLELLRKEQAEIVIVDMIMPGMNGVDVIKQIRQEFDEIKIIAISGGGNAAPIGYEPSAIATTAYLASAFEAGAHHILTKPFEREKLIEVVHDLMNE